MAIFESTRRMTPSEQQCLEIGQKEGRVMERQKILDDVMSLIDGHYDNPNLAGELENYFGITFQEWNKLEENTL